MKHYQSLAHALDDLKIRGYDADFEPEANCLYCNALDMRLSEAEFQIDEVYHFEGRSRWDDSAVLYAFTSPGGVKGTVVDRYEAYRDNARSEVAKICSAGRP